MKRTVSAALIAVCLLAAAHRAAALINPSLPLGSVADRARMHALVRIEAVDYDKGSATAKVLGAIGGFTPKTVTLAGRNETGKGLVMSLAEGQELVGLLGKNGRRRPLESLIYVGGGTWYEANLSDLQKPDTWILTRNPDADEDASSSQIMFGTFNGRIERMWEFLNDQAAGRAYFPHYAFGAWETKPLAQQKAAVSAVALADLDGDGAPECIAADESSIRIWRLVDGKPQTLKAPQGGASSLAAGDVDGDGDVDLLADDRLWINEKGSWRRDDSLPAARGELVVSTLADLDADGRLDVVLSIKKGGLRVFSKREGRWEDRTAALGFDKTAGSTGWIDVGHWDDDGLPDLVYTNADVTLLLPGGRGKRTARRLRGGAFSERDGQKQGAPALGALWKPDCGALMVNWDTGCQLLAPAKSRAEDVTGATNEFQEPIGRLLMSLTEDFNADGRTDALLLGGKTGGARLQLNRGYGSYMMVSKYSPKASLPDSLSSKGPVCAAAGDLDGDGDVDVLFGCLDGSVVLAWNRTLESRPDKPEKATPYHARKRIGAHRICVRFAPELPGVRGALLTAQTADGRTVWRKTIGGNVGVGGSGPLSAAVVLREPGEYKLLLQTTDGRKRETSLKLPARPEGTSRDLVFK